MYRQQQPIAAPLLVNDEVVDLVYALSGRRLPADHGWALSRAIAAALPWFEDDPVAGLHLIHGAASINGWQRPGPAGMIELSQRTRLVLRLGREQLAAGRQLCGQSLSIAGHAIDIGDARVRMLVPLPNVFAHYMMITPDTEDEDDFLAHTAGQLEHLAIRPSQILCGRQRWISTPDGPIATRSLLLAELKASESIALQQLGLGPGRKVGCGIFVPHKDIAALSEPLGYPGTTTDNRLLPDNTDPGRLPLA